MNLIGDNVIKRWIHTDPLYIKGIRDYRSEDRFKDIHWKSSLKSDKLIVKEYDFTSDREIVVIVNVQCAENAWLSVDRNRIEAIIGLAASLCYKCLNMGSRTGMWTNAKLTSLCNNFKKEVYPSLNSLKKY